MGVVLDRRAFIAAAACAGLSACGGPRGGGDAQGVGDAQDNGALDEEPSPQNDEPVESGRTRNDYPWDFVTTLGPFDGLVSTPSDTPGTVESLTYACHAYAIEATDGTDDVMVEKTLNVYLPNGYDPARPYDVLYLLHGTGGMHDYWLGKPQTKTGDYHGESTANLLDAMHDEGLFGDVIVVAPTYYSVPEGYDVDVTFAGSMAGGDPYADEWPLHFWRELREDVIPLVEAAYPTYAAGDVSAEALVASRDHRAFAGLSRGSKTVMSSGMTHCTDLFAWFGCFSGAWTDLDAFRAALEGEFSEHPIRLWYNGNGSRDFSLDNHQEFVAQALAQMPDRFRDGENYAWVSFPGGEHAYDCWALDLYNCLVSFFS